MKKLDFYKFVSTNKVRVCLTGVYHKDGYKWATNGKALIKAAESYPAKFEGKIISKEQTYIDAQFPDCKRVIPEMADMQEVVGLPSNEDLVKEFKSLKALFSIHKKIGEWYSFGYILPNQSAILFENWEKIIRFLEVFPDAKLYCHKEGTEHSRAAEQSLMLVSGENLLVVMPALIFNDDEPKPVGYHWSYDSFNNKEYDFPRLLQRVGTKGIAERYQIDNLTDKDNTLINNLYRYFEIVPHDFKGEAA